MSDKGYKASKKQAGNSNYSQGLVYLIASAFLLYGNLSKDGAKYMTKLVGDAVYSFYSDSSLPSIPVSKALNLEGKVADCADNAVRISSMNGIGNGVITDPYTIHTAYHVIEYAHKNNKAIFIQSQTYLKPDESIMLLLSDANVKYSSANDRAEITLNHPFYNAHSIPIKPNIDIDKATDSGINLAYIGYRDKAIFHTLGHITAVYANPNDQNAAKGARYYKTDMNVGPGNSGGMVIMPETGELVGIASFVVAKSLDNKFDSSFLYFTDIGNPLDNK